MKLSALIASIALFPKEAIHKMSPDDRKKYALLSLTVLIPVIMGFAGMLHTAFEYTKNIAISFLIAGVFSLIVYIIEVAVLRLVDFTKQNRWVILSLRLLLSLVVSFVLAFNFILMIFSDTLNASLTLANQKKIDSVHEQAISKKAGFDQQLRVKDSLISLHRAELTRQIETGKGMRFAFHDSLISSLQLERNQLLAERDSASAAIDLATTNTVETYDKASSQDVLAKSEALAELLAHSASARLVTIAILLFLLTLDLMPIAIKSLSGLLSTSPSNSLAPITRIHRSSSEKTFALDAELDTLLLDQKSVCKAVLEATAIKQSGQNVVREKMAGSADQEALKLALGIIDAHFQDTISRFQSKIGGPQVSSSIVNPIPAKPSDEYLLYIAQPTAFPPHHPFAIGDSVVAETTRIIESLSDRSERSVASAIYGWVETNIPYDSNFEARKPSYRTANQTYLERSGICGEQTALLISMLRVAKIDARYASVKIDCKGERVAHACCCIFYQDGEQQLFDVAYKQVGPEHQEWSILSDQAVLERFQSWNNES